LDMVQFAQRILAESSRWLQLASDRRLRNISLGQVCRIINLASRLGRLSCGLPTDGEPQRRDRAAYLFTGPSVEEAMRRIYGSTKEGPSGANREATPGGGRASGASPPAQSADAQPPQTGLNVATVQPAAPPPGPPYRRRDAWGAWARQQRRAPSMQGAGNRPEPDRPCMVGPQQDQTDQKTTSGHPR
jgi:hypothetical protein